MLGILVIAALSGGLIATFAYFRPEARARRELRAAALYRIADLPDGVRGRIAGRAYPLTEALRAPLSGRPCVYFIARVEERNTDSDGDTWVKLVDEYRGVPFGIQDGSGRAIIDATKARLALDFDGTSQSRPFGDMSKSEVEQAFLARHGVTGKRYSTLRYTEAIIGVDEAVAVLGAGVREPDPDASPTGAYRGELPTRLRLTSSAAHPLVISDAPSTTA